MNQGQAEKLKKLIVTSPILNGAERSEWSALLELMNDKQLGEFEKILSSNVQLPVKPQPAPFSTLAPRPQILPVKPVTANQQPQSKSPVQQGYGASQKPTPPPLVMPQIRPMPKAPITPAGKGASGFSHIMNMPTQAAPPPASAQIKNPQAPQNSGFLNKIKRAFSQKELPADKPEFELELPAPAKKQQESSKQIMPVPSLSPKPASPVLPPTAVKAQVYPPAVPKPAAVLPSPPVSRPVEFANAKKIFDAAQFQASRGQSAPVQQKISQSGIERTNNQDQGELAKPGPAAAPAPFLPGKESLADVPSGAVFFQNIEHQELVVNNQGTGQGGFVSGLKIVPEKTDDVSVAAGKNKEPLPSPKYQVVQDALRDIQTKPPAEKDLSGGGLNFAKFSPVGNIKASSLNTLRPAEGLAETFKAHLRPGSIALPSLESLPQLTLDSFEKAGGGGLSKALKDLIRTHGYFEVMLNLEKSGLYKKYLATGAEILKGNNFAELTSGQNYLTKERFEEFVDMLREVRAGN